MKGVGGWTPPSPAWLLRRISSGHNLPPRNLRIQQCGGSGQKLMLMHLLWYWANAGTKTTAEVVSGEGRNLRISPRRRMAEGKTEDAAGLASLRGAWATGVAKPRNLWRRSDEGPAAKRRIQAFNKLRPLARNARGVWNYINDLWLVGCNMGICRDIPPPSRGIFVIVLDRFSSPI